MEEVEVGFPCILRFDPVCWILRTLGGIRVGTRGTDWDLVCLLCFHSGATYVFLQGPCQILPGPRDRFSVVNVASADAIRCLYLCNSTIRFFVTTPHISTIAFKPELVRVYWCTGNVALSLSLSPLSPSTGDNIIHVDLSPPAVQRDSTDP